MSAVAATADVVIGVASDNSVTQGLVAVRAVGQEKKRSRFYGETSDPGLLRRKSDRPTRAGVPTGKGTVRPVLGL